MVNKLSKITSHLVYVASSNNAQIWINSDVWLSFSHKLFCTCMAHYICISEMSRATEITISRAAVMWQKHVIRNKPSFVHFKLLRPAVAAVRWGLALDFTVCYDVTEHVDFALITNQKWVCRRCTPSNSHNSLMWVWYRLFSFFAYYWNV